MDTQNIHTCKRCGIRYDWRKSPSSSLKMTYCGSLCETGDLGFTIEGMLGDSVLRSPAKPSAPGQQRDEPSPMLAA